MMSGQPDTWPGPAYGLYAAAMHRPTLGVVAGLLVVGGATAMLVDLGQGHVVWGGMLLRAGLVLGAVWLVLPAARRIPTAGWLGIGIFAAVIIVRPRLVLWGLAVAIAVTAAALIPRGRS
jgi:hypothetical protein